MLALLITPMFAAAGYSLIYLLFGGGLGGRADFHRGENVRQMSVVEDSKRPTANRHHLNQKAKWQPISS